MTSDEAIMARVQASAQKGETTELDSVPKHLWDTVCDSNREIQDNRWRSLGWHISSVKCDKGCCVFTRMSPPSVAPENVQASKCMRGVKREVLASYRDSNPRS